MEGYLLVFALFLIVGGAVAFAVAYAVLKAGERFYERPPRRPARHPGLCPRCGYDLRAGPRAGEPLLRRCPECGWERDDVNENR
jgi:hypothetical protein